jgi:hypothetical protein
VNKWFFLLALLLLLTACDEQYESYYYFSHPERLEHSALSCQALSAAKFRQSKQCHMIFEQANLLQAYSREFISNQPLFGQKIVALQIRLAHIEQQESEEKGEALSEKAKSLRYQIKRRLFVVKQFMRPGLQ